MLSIAEVFIEEYYLETNPQAAESVSRGEFPSALDHFLEVGINEELRFSPLIDLDYYKRVANPDLVDFTSREALDFLLESGLEEEHPFSQFIDLEFYQEVNPQLSDLDNFEAFLHLQEIGIEQGLQFSSFLDLEEFKSFTPALGEASNFEAFAEIATFFAPEEEGQFRIPLGRGLSIPDIVEVITPESLAGPGEVVFTYSKSDDRVVMDIEKEGLPFRPDFTRPEDISTPFNEQLVSIEDAKWQVWLTGHWFDIESTFWYDGLTGQLLGNEFDLNFDLIGGPPQGNSPVDINGDGVEDTAVQFPVAQAVGTEIFEGTPEGSLNVSFEYDYDQILDERGTAGFYAAALPFNIDRPDLIGIYYTEGGLPLSEAMTWDDIVAGIRNQEILLHISLSLEPDPKPEFLDSRPNQMEGPLLFYPDIIPDDIVYEPINDRYKFADPEELETFIGAPPFPGRTAFQNGELELGLELVTTDANGGLAGGRANDRLDASSGGGHNQLFGGGGDDELLAGERDRLLGGEGDDLLDASLGAGNNRLLGEDGDDVLFAGERDQLSGGNGEDLLEASFGAGRNKLDGDANDDTFFLGSRDRLVGGNGADEFFVGSGGHNLMTGGAGADQFWVANSELPETVNRISDFEVGVDVIGISGLSGVSSIEDLSFAQVGRNTLISIEEQSIAFLTGVQVDNLQANGQFVFA